MSFFHSGRADGGKYIPLSDQVQTPAFVAGHRDYQQNPYQSPPKPGYADGPPGYDGYEGYRVDPPHVQNLQTRYTQMQADDQLRLELQYSPTRQFWRLVGKLFLRWFMTVLLCAAVVGLMWYYYKKNVMSPAEKRMFNALSVGLGLALGMNIIASFKSMADMMKWRILASAPHTAREIDLILGLGSYQKVTSLALISTGKPMFFLLAICWVLLGIGANIGVSLIGLTYNHESDGALKTTPGIVNMTNLDAFYRSSRYIPDTPPAKWVQQGLAHLFGDASYNLQEQDPTSLEFDPNLQYIAVEMEEYPNWKYHFREFDSAASLMHRTNRSVTVMPQCEYFPIVAGQWADNYTYDGPILIQTGPDTTIEIDWMNDYAGAATTWIYPSEDNELYPCGPRCSRVYAASFLSVHVHEPDPNAVGHFFNCTATISEMANAHANNPLHKLPDEVASIAAGSIGLEGYGEDYQYVRYGSGLYWGAFNGEYGNDSMATAYKLGRFAVGTIAGMDMYNPNQEAPGDRPWIGVLLKVKWRELGLTLGIIIFVQTILAVVTAFTANKVFCKDDSFLSTARLLRPVVERLGPSGCASSGSTIAATLRTKMTYGVRSVGGRHHLDIGEDIQPNFPFPGGHYNGEGDWLLAGEKHESV